MVSLLTVLLVVALVGLIVSALIRYIPMPEVFRVIIIVIAAIAVILWLLNGGVDRTARGLRFGAGIPVHDGIATVRA